MEIKIEYNGTYPNLCSGDLTVIIDGKRWEFPEYCLRSGGNIWFDDDGTEHVDCAKWTVADWPPEFPKELRNQVIETLNNQIPHGCCGGCI